MLTRQSRTLPETPVESDLTRADRLLSVLQALRGETAEPLQSECGWIAERALLRAMIDQVPDYLMAKDTEGRFIVVNEAVAADYGMNSPDELIGKTDFDIHNPKVAERFFAIEQHIMSSGTAMIDMEETIIDVFGNEKLLCTSKMPLRNDQNQVIGLVGISRDVTERTRAERQIRFMAHHDALTGLPNRILLTDRLTQAILQSQRREHRLTLIFLDLDNFKTVNDSLGHSGGDQLLKVVASRLSNSLRATDTVARLGGDEFVILLTEQSESLIQISKILEKIRIAMAEPIAIFERSVALTFSAGVAAFPYDGADAETLLANADAAMYRAKASGRDTVQFYTADMNSKRHEKLVLQQQLREGIARSELFLEYQPQLDLQSGRVFALEALVRWNHPSMGTLYPDSFVQLAEESGLMVALGEWVLQTACRQNRAWQDAGMEPVSISVNVSPRQFRERNWVGRVREALAESGLEARYLELELTESLIMNDPESAASKMKELTAIGVTLSIDDFGTGYSSLSALKAFPVSRLKLDRSFVRNLPRDENDKAIAAAIISMGQKLGLKVIAEGVETDAQMNFLRDNQCDEIQGYRVSRPIQAAAVLALLERPEPLS